MAEENWKRPARKLLTLRWLEMATVTIVGVAGAAPSGGPIAALGAVALGGLFAWVQWRRFHSWGYAEREDDLLVRRGVMFSRLSVIPYGRMQFIDVTAGPLERMFGLATVKMHTAAAASDARIPGLERREAERLRDRLAELGEAQAAGL